MRSVHPCVVPLAMVPLLWMGTRMIVFRKGKERMSDGCVLHIRIPRLSRCFFVTRMKSHAMHGFPGEVEPGKTHMGSGQMPCAIRCTGCPRLISLTCLGVHLNWSGCIGAHATRGFSRPSLELRAVRASISITTSKVPPNPWSFAVCIVGYPVGATAPHPDMA
jgi:hypothetical protein